MCENGNQTNYIYIYIFRKEITKKFIYYGKKMTEAIKNWPKSLNFEQSIKESKGND